MPAPARGWSSNYTITYVNGNLTVNPAPLTVTPTAKSMTYGGTVPTLTYTYTGLVPGDTASFTGSLATTATSSSNVGSYAITQGTLAATGNYTIGTFNPAAPTVGNAGFEAPPIGNGYVYNPTGTAWTFSGSPGSGSGVAGNNSAFTSGNPAAPQGTQVAFLQSHGTITQSVAGWSAGTYTISFAAAKRGNNGGNQDFQVLVDGSVVGTFKPTTTTYQTYSTPTFTVAAAGAHHRVPRPRHRRGRQHRLPRRRLPRLRERADGEPGRRPTITLATSANPAVPGQSVTFTAIVAPVAPGGGTPTGSVTFKNGSTVLGTVPLSVVGGQDQATFTTSFSTAGTPTITAAYGNTDGNYTASSASLTQTVLAPGVYVSGTTLYVVGASTSDNASISSAGTNSNGSTGLQINSTLNGVYTSKTFTQTFTAIVIAGYAGNDNVQLASGLTLPTTVTEGNGNNYIQLGGGNDTVTLGTGSNQVFGGNGNKTITASDSAGTTGYISLGNGNDTISLGAGNDQVVLGTGNNVVTAGNGTDAVTTSGSGNNSITLGNGNDSVTTGNGNDTIALGSGNENIQTGNGNKTISAGDGNSYVKAGTGTDVITLGNGTDNVQLGGGNNTVSLGNGNDYLSAGNGNNTMTVGNGNDNVQLGDGDNVVIEGNGNDYVSAGNGANLVVGGLGKHTIQLGNGTDILIDGSASVVNAGDSFRQILTDWKASSSTQVNQRISVNYNAVYSNYLSAGSGRDWFFYHAPTTSNKKSTDRLN